jgi:hypothetical protein
LLDALFAKTRKQWWYLDDKIIRVHPPGTGIRVAKLLLQRIAGYGSQRDCRIPILLQGKHANEDSAELVEHAHARGIPLLDLIAKLDEGPQRGHDPRQLFVEVHMNRAGNRWVANQVAIFLRSARS